MATNECEMRSWSLSKKNSTNSSAELLIVSEVESIMLSSSTVSNNFVVLRVE